MLSGKSLQTTCILAVPLIGIAMVAFYTPELDMDQLSHKLSVQLLNMMPESAIEERRSKGCAKTADEGENVTEAAPTPTPAATVAASESNVVLTRRSSFDPAGPYNSRKSLEKRAEGLREACLKYQDFMRPELVLSRQDVDEKDILVNAASETTFCTIPKVAQKPMTTLFNRIRTPSKEEDNKLKYFKANFPNSMRSFKSAILVRHPLERLVSAYRNLYEKTYNPISGEEEGGEISWLDFIYIVLNGPVEYAEFLEQHEMESGSVAIDTGMIDGKGASKSWAPYWMQCGVCNPLSMPDFVLHLDHIKEDTKTMLDLLEIPASAYKGWLESKTEPKSSIREVEEHYYGQLTKDEIRALHDKYRHDHEIFGFTPDYYIALGKDDDVE